MAKSSLSFTCTGCGAAYPKWSGRCEACGAWNSIVEEAPLSVGPKLALAKGRTVALTDLSAVADAPPRRPSGMAEFDRVLGGVLELKDPERELLRMLAIQVHAWWAWPSG